MDIFDSVNDRVVFTVTVIIDNTRNVSECLLMPIPIFRTNMHLEQLELFVFRSVHTSLSKAVVHTLRTNRFLPFASGVSIFHIEAEVRKSLSFLNMIVPLAKNSAQTSNSRWATVSDLGSKARPVQVQTANCWCCVTVADGKSTRR